MVVDIWGTDQYGSRNDEYVSMWGGGFLWEYLSGDVKNVDGNMNLRNSRDRIRS